MIRCGGAAKGAKGGHVLWFVPARRMHANEKRPPFPNVNITHQAIRVCYRSKQSRLRPPRPPAQRREGLVSGAAVGHRRVQQMQDLAKCGMARRLQQVLIGRNKTSSCRKGTLERGQSFSDGIEMSTFCSSSSFENHSLFGDPSFHFIPRFCN